ncbi:MAK10-like protein [Tanacetum coccineum]
MGDANPIRTLRDYSRPSHEGYKNTIKLLEGNNVVPLQSDTIRLVQNGCSFNGLWSEDPNQHLKDFLKLVDSLGLDGANRERIRLRLFQFSLRDQASNWLERLPAGSISTWEDLTTRFLAQFFPPGRMQNSAMTSLCSNNIKESLFLKHGLCEIDRAADGKLRDKNADESWEIIENLALYDHERWNDSTEFVKLVKAISMPQGTSKMPDRILLELEDQINFLLKGPRPTLRPSPTHVPQAYPQALETTFEARVRDYMAAHVERIERFENTIFKQCEVVNDRMTEMFRLFKELSTSRTPKKVLIKEEARHPITKNINSISIIRVEEEKTIVNNRAIVESIVEPRKSEEEEPPKKASVMNKVERRVDDEPTKSVRENVTKNEEEEPAGVSSSHTIGYYLKHRINEKLIKGLVENQKFNDSLSRVRIGKIKWKTYNLSPRRPIYEAILKKKITKKDDIGGNFEIPCNIGGLKRINALVDQGSDVNVVPLSTYVKLTGKRPAKTNVRLSLASYSYIYPLGIVKDILVDVVGYVYPMDFVILDIKEDEKRPFILGTPFLTTAKAVIKFDKGTITLRSGKSRKAHLLKDKQIPSVESVETASHLDSIRDLAMASRCSRLKEDLESSTWRRRHRLQSEAVTSSFNLSEALNRNITAVLAVLNTGASQSRQRVSSENVDDLMLRLNIAFGFLVVPEAERLHLFEYHLTRGSEGDDRNVFDLREK